MGYIKYLWRVLKERLAIFSQIELHMQKGKSEGNKNFDA